MATPQRETIVVGQIEINWLLGSESSDGSIALFEFTVPPKARVPLAHSHDGYEETIYGLQGVLTMTVAGDERGVAAGEVLHLPRGVVHKFENRGDVDARGLAIITPAALGPGYFRDIAALLQSGGPPDPVAVGEVMRRHGLTPVPD